MRIADGYLLREIAGSWVVIPVGQKLVEFNGLISLTESGAQLWQMLEHGSGREPLIDRLTDRYSVSRDIAACDVDDFLNDLSTRQLLV